MRLTRKQLTHLVERYLREQEEEILEDPVEEEPVEEEPVEEDPVEEDPVEEDPVEIKNKIEFEVKSFSRTYDIALVKREGEDIHKIFIDGKQSQSITSGLPLNIIAAHGYINKKTSEENKSLLLKILQRDPNFKGKSDQGVLAVIDQKFDLKGVQSYGMPNLEDILNKG